MLGSKLGHIWFCFGWSAVISEALLLLTRKTFPPSLYLCLCVNFLRGTGVYMAAPGHPESIELAMITAVTTEHVI